MKDLLLNENFDLDFSDDDFSFGETTQQNQGLILLANKGEFRQSPFVGVGLKQYVEDDQLGAMRTELARQLELDGMYIQNLTVFSNGRVLINATYEQTVL